MISIPRLQNTFGQVLKELRNENGLSQQQLAFDSELDRTYISLLERGLRLPTLGTIFKIAEVLKLSPSDMVTRVEKSLKRK
jgi:transcriptional regulator with XRE-family HTH domain